MTSSHHLRTSSSSNHQKNQLNLDESLPRKRTNNIITNFYKKQLETTHLLKPKIQQIPPQIQKIQAVQDEEDSGKKTIQQNANRIPDIIKQLMNKQKKKGNHLPNVQRQAKYKFQKIGNILEAQSSKTNVPINIPNKLNRQNTSSNYKINYNIKSKSIIDTQTEQLEIKLIKRQNSNQTTSQKIHNTSLNSYESSQSISRSIKFQEWESNQKQLQNSLENQTNKNKSVTQINKQKRLFQVDQNLLKSYLLKKGELSIEANIEQVYDFFSQLCIYVEIIFENPLIKKYKNCIYFGENSTNHDKLCQGFLYHYHNKIYFGEFKKGKRHGNGCQMSIKQDIVTRGYYEEGYKKGNFKVLKKNDYQYLGQMKNGIFQGYGTLTTKQSKYEGQFYKGMKHGKGIQHFFYENKNYNGIYFEGKFEGRGQITAIDYHYQGMFHQGLPQGLGKQRRKNQQYNGQFSKGQREGNGQLLLENGDVYIGKFKNGLMHGQGKLILKKQNGKQLIGNFQNGKFIQKQQQSNLNPRRLINNNMYQRRYKMLNIMKDYDNSNINQDRNITNAEMPRNQRYPRFNPQTQGDDKIFRKKIDNPLYSQKQKIYQTQIPTFSQSKNDQTQQLQNKSIKIKSASLDFSVHSNNSKTSINKSLKFDYSKFQSSLDDQIPSFSIIKKNLENKLK